MLLLQYFQEKYRGKLSRVFLMIASLAQGTRQRGEPPIARPFAGYWQSQSRTFSRATMVSFHSLHDERI
jgi:hypothetical protein